MGDDVRDRRSQLRLADSVQLDALASRQAQRSVSVPIGELVESDYATVTLDTKIELLQGVLNDAKVAIVIEHEQVAGIVTKIDLIDYLARPPAKVTAPAEPAAKAAAKKRNGSSRARA